MKQGKIVFQGVTRKGTAITIRYPKSGDVSAFLKYINALSQERTFILAQGKKFKIEEEKKWLEDKIKNIGKKRTVMLAVFVGKELAGSASVEQESDAFASQGIFHIGIAKKFRGEGIGKLLMALAIEEAALNLKGLRMITLNVFANNPVAINLYKKMGFKKFGSLPKSTLHRGKYVDNYYMYLNL